MDFIETVQHAAVTLRGKIKIQPEVGIILGSGLGHFVSVISDAVVISNETVPGMPSGSVVGHEGKIVCGKIAGREVMVLQGRVHYYEGFSMQEVTFGVRLMQELGIKKLIITNACGGLNSAFHAGAIMLINDHINFMGDNPLIGKNNDAWGPRFPDMSEAWSLKMRKLAQKKAAETNVGLFEGVYAAVTGPYYSPKAELALLRNLGADAIGMSTVPEIIAAVHGGMEVLGFAVVTDMAVPETLEKPEHSHIVEVANRAGLELSRLMVAVLPEL